LADRAGPGARTALDLGKQFGCRGGAGSAARRSRGMEAASIAAVLFAAAFAVLAAIHFREKAPEEHTVRFLLPLPEKTSFVSTDLPVLSPDATRIVSPPDKQRAEPCTSGRWIQPRPGGCLEQRTRSTHSGRRTDAS